MKPAIKPVIKWVGGKTQMLQELESAVRPMLTGENAYYEPFVGGGALAFGLAYGRTVINDANPELIGMYEAIRDDKDQVMALLDMLRDAHSEENYYEVRGWDRDPSGRPHVKNGAALMAARTIYLNKTCFNGLYRVNSKGFFNSPIGKTSSGAVPQLYDEGNIGALSRFLKESCLIRCGGYEKAVSDAKAGDVVFLDPPYDRDEDIRTGGFVGYVKGGWTKEDTRHLREVCDDLRARGVRVVVTNNDTAFVRGLFEGYEIREISVKRSINRDAAGRKGKEVIIVGK